MREEVTNSRKFFMATTIRNRRKDGAASTATLGFHPYSLEPELVRNARRIEMLKARDKSINTRLAAIELEAKVLRDEAARNTTELATLVRRNDQLSVF